MNIIDITIQGRRIIGEYKHNKDFTENWEIRIVGDDGSTFLMKMTKFELATMLALTIANRVVFDADLEKMEENLKKLPSIYKI